MKEIVIKIPDEVYKYLEKRIKFGMATEMDEIVWNGKVLPEGHGRLIDADTLADGFEDNYEFCEALNATPTMVEADKGDPDGNK